GAGGRRGEGEADARAPAGDQSARAAQAKVHAQRLSGPGRPQLLITSSEMSAPARALLTGQELLACSAISANLSAVTPSAEPRTVSLMPLIRKPPAGSGPTAPCASPPSTCPP